jgi:hypothetical protein
VASGRQVFAVQRRIAAEESRRAINGQSSSPTPPSTVLRRPSSSRPPTPRRGTLHLPCSTRMSSRPVAPPRYPRSVSVRGKASAQLNIVAPLQRLLQHKVMKKAARICAQAARCCTCTKKKAQGRRGSEEYSTTRNGPAQVRAPSRGRPGRQRRAGRPG